MSIHSDFATDSDRSEVRRARRHLLSWAVGNDRWFDGGSKFCPSVVVEDPGHLDALIQSDVVGKDSVVFATEFSDEQSSRCVPVTSEGSLAEPGSDIMILDDFFVETQDYASTGLGVTMGNTLVRITCEEDLVSFFDDADKAFEDGDFGDVLVSPESLITDRPALENEPMSDGPELRLYIDADGVASVGPYGAPLGKAGDSYATLKGVWQSLVDDAGGSSRAALAKAVDLTGLEASIAKRPWLSRYLMALDAISSLTARGASTLNVSGFGGYLMNRLDEIPPPMGTEVPVLLRDHERSYLYMGDSGRSVSFVLEAAEVVEALVVCDSLDEASEFVNRAGLEQVHRSLLAASPPIDLLKQS